VQVRLYTGLRIGDSMYCTHDSCSLLYIHTLVFSVC
jgi:hypothetical protein